MIDYSAYQRAQRRYEKARRDLLAMETAPDAYDLQTSSLWPESGRDYERLAALAERRYATTMATLNALRAMRRAEFGESSDALA